MDVKQQQQQQQQQQRLHEDTRSVLNAAISRFVESANTGKPPAQGADFFPAERFEGPKHNFFFSTGVKGTGYYLDPKAVVEVEQSKAAGGAGPSEVKEKPRVDAKVLLKEAEDNATAAEPLDAKGVRRLVLAFERKYKENLEQRMKYADQPERFMTSEVDLDQCVQSFLQLVNNPEQYPVFVEANAVSHLLSLLTHENTDISIDVVDLLQALTDTEDNDEWEAEFRALVSSMVENNALELLVQRLEQLNESVEEEANSIFNILGIIENMIDVMPEVSTLVVERKILRWMLHRLRPRDFDSIKQYVAELLAVLMQGGEANLRAMGESGGIDCLLEGVALFKSKDPQTDDENEFLENLFDALCSCMLLPENRAKIVESEGLELMLLILKQKKIARYGAIKVLEFATTQCPLACDRFVDLLGLKTLFALFMGRTKFAHKRDREKDQLAEEELVIIIANLFQEIMKGSRRERVAAKFVENEFEKCDRLIEIYFIYNARLKAEEARLSELEEPLPQDEILVSRINSGLAVLQQVCLIISHLWSIGDAALNRRLLLLLHQKGHTLVQPRTTLKEMISMIGGEGLQREQQQQRLRKLLVGLGGEETLEEPQVQDSQVLQSTNGKTASVAEEGNAKTQNDAVKETVQAHDLASTSNPTKETEKARDVRKNSTSEKDKERDKAREKRRERDQRRDRHKDKDIHHHRDKRQRGSRDGSRRDSRRD